MKQQQLEEVQEVSNFDMLTLKLVVDKYFLQLFTQDFK